MSHVIVREFNPQLDSGFLYSTWPKNVFYSGIHIDLEADKKAWFEDFHAYMKKVMPDAEIYIACMYDDPGTILGYSIVYGKMLQFVYVKELFRKQGIAKLLLKRQKLTDNIHVNDIFITRIGLAIMSEHEEAFTQPVEEPKETYDDSNDIHHPPNDSKAH